MEKVRLGDLKKDKRLLEMRKTNTFTVSRYRQAMREGATFPPLIISDNNRIICGYHRFDAAVAEYGKDHEYPVMRETFKDFASELEYFARDNGKHGLPLTGISRKLIADKLAGYGRSPEQIARIFNVAPVRIEKWGDDLNTVNVVIREVRGGKEADKEYRSLPVKHGYEPTRSITEEEYRQHLKADMGVPIVAHCEQLIRWIEGRLVNLKKEENIVALKALKKSLDRIL